MKACSSHLGTDLATHWGVETQASAVGAHDKITPHLIGGTCRRKEIGVQDEKYERELRPSFSGRRRQELCVN